ncbi:MAG TPA: ZIP family metal transporter [Solirubrobacteraceae bacterium]|nr:ZIP family metal transporter [Solirubrobacteraceae bacterium]
MSFSETVALGALAGFTIYLGLPVGRLQLLGSRARVALAMFAVGVLAFIFVDVMKNGGQIVNTAVDQIKHHQGSWGHLIWLVVLLGAGFSAGSAGLAVLERRLRPLGGRTPIAGGADAAAAVSPSEAEALAVELDAARTRALRRGLTIAAAIGVHNFAEGLAIGVSARAGAISLATVLIVGFALHNATEGFGIVGPLGDVRPSWGWLGLVGLIAGGPTFLGSMVGYAVTSHPLELLFYATAGGAILYVIGEVWTAMRRMGHRELGLLMLTGGFMVGVITDLVITYGGG